MKSFLAQTHYEVLEVSVGATTEEIWRAWERLNRLYSEEQVALYGLVDAERADMLRQRLRQAVEVLTDEAQREAYDASIGLPPRDRMGGAPAPKPVPSTPGPAESMSTGAWARDYSWVTPASPASTVDARASQDSVSVSASVSAAHVEWSEAPRPSSPRSALVSAIPAAGLTGPGPTVQAPSPKPEDGPADGAGVRHAQESAEPSCPKVALAPVESMPGEGRAGSSSEAKRVFVAGEDVPGGRSVGEEVPAAAPRADVNATAMAAGNGMESAIVPPKATPTKEYRPEPRPRPYEVPAGVEINGDLLRQVRMARGLSLLQLSERTRISTRHLENVEADRYDLLPAPVYLRGILMSVARELGLDGLRVAKSYLAFVEARRTKG